MKKQKKVAFCFSGQARTFELCFPYIKKNLLDPVGKNRHDYDVFCCVEDDEHAEIIKLLKPAKLLKIKSKDFSKEYEDIFRSNYKKFFSRGNINNHLNQLRKIHLSNELRKKFQERKNISYKYVVRMRFDILPISQVNYSVIDERFIYTPKTKLEKNIACNDIIAIGSEENMDIYSRLMDSYREILKTFYSDEFKISLKTSLFIEKIYVSFFEFLSRNTFGSISVFFKKIIPLRGKIFLRPPKKNYYMIEYALHRYLKKNGVNIKELPLDYIVVRKDWDKSGVLLHEQN